MGEVCRRRRLGRDGADRPGARGVTGHRSIAQLHRNRAILPSADVGNAPDCRVVGSNDRSASILHPNMSDKGREKAALPG